MHRLKDENKRAKYEALRWYDQLRPDTRCQIKNEFNLDRRYLNPPPTWIERLIETKREVENNTEISL